MQHKIPAVFMRGGTSRAVFFTQAAMQPYDDATRDAIILTALGSPDPYGRQIDGLGGGISSLSKAAIIGPCGGPAADVTFNFAQVDVHKPFVDWSGTCGNMSAAVGPFAIDEGLVMPVEPVTRVWVLATNTGKRYIAPVPVQDGRARGGGQRRRRRRAGHGCRHRVGIPRTGRHAGRRFVAYRTAPAADHLVEWQRNQRLAGRCGPAHGVRARRGVGCRRHVAGAAVGRRYRAAGNPGRNPLPRRRAVRLGGRRGAGHPKRSRPCPRLPSWRPRRNTPAAPASLSPPTASTWWRGPFPCATLTARFPAPSPCAPRWPPRWRAPWYTRSPTPSAAPDYASAIPPASWKSPPRCFRRTASGRSRASPHGAPARRIMEGAILVPPSAMAGRPWFKAS